MERRARRSERGPWGLPAGILLAVVVAAHPAYPQEAEEVSGRHVRAGDQKAAALLRLGVTASPTFRLLLGTLEHSDLIVYVETRPMSLPGQLQLAAVASGCPLPASVGARCRHVTRTSLRGWDTNSSTRWSWRVLPRWWTRAA